jgi:Holliday junction resolvasome RuvABC endonuclease subunit
MQITIVTGVEKLGNGIISDMGRRAVTVVTRECLKRREDSDAPKRLS